MYTIEVKNLTKDYGFGRGVFNVNFNINKGEVFGFLGPNGAGKSTTIRHLMGFSKPQSGETRIFGKETFGEYYNILQHVGYIPGEIALPRGLSGYEFIKMMQDLHNIHNKEKLLELLDMFKLDNITLNSETKRMSLGVKRKLAIVTAFMHDPDVLILDEPTSGLDPVMQEEFIQYIHKEKEMGKTILLSSHIFSEIDSTCDRIAIIKDGKVCSEFVANDLKHSSIKFYQISFCNENDTEQFLKDCGMINSFKIIDKDIGNIFVSFEDSELNEIISKLSQYEIKYFSNQVESLEDYFMKFYKEDKNYGGALQ